MIKKSLIIGAIFCSISAVSQEEGWMTFPTQLDSTEIKKVELDYSGAEGKVSIEKDARLDKLEKFVRAGEENLEGVMIDGYRVMIYFDQDKTKSEQQKAHFMNLYEEHKTYIDYLAPNYRVRVGNFRTELEGIKLKQDLLGVFPTAIVVKDKIQLPVFVEEN